MTDPISDMLARIRNANRALLPGVEMPHSKIKENIASILKNGLDRAYAREPTPETPPIRHGNIRGTGYYH